MFGKGKTPQQRGREKQHAQDRRVRKLADKQDDKDKKENDKK